LERGDGSRTKHIVETTCCIRGVGTARSALWDDRSEPAAGPAVLLANALPHPERRECQGTMRNFLFKCSRLGLLVQASIAESALPEEGSLVPYECPACGATHLVDPRNSENQPPPLQSGSD
jgi:hypothetical protein